MNGIDKITARIEADAVAEAAQISAEAEAQCAKINADAEKQAQDQYWQRLRAGMKTVEDRSTRLAGTADMEAKKNVLAFKQETVASVFEAARTRILAMPEEDYIRFLTDKAAAAAETGSEELILNAKDKSAIGEKVLAAANQKLSAAGKPAALTLSDQTGDFAAGLKVRRGSVEYNCTLEALMDQAKEELSAEIANMLFA